MSLQVSTGFVQRLHYSHVEDSEKQAAVAQAFASMKVEGEVEGLVEGPSNPTKKAD